MAKFDNVDPDHVEDHEMEDEPTPEDGKEDHESARATETSRGTSDIDQQLIEIDRQLRKLDTRELAILDELAALVEQKETLEERHRELSGKVHDREERKKARLRSVMSRHGISASPSEPSAEETPVSSPETNVVPIKPVEESAGEKEATEVVPEVHPGLGDRHPTEPGKFWGGEDWVSQSEMRKILDSKADALEEGEKAEESKESRITRFLAKRNPKKSDDTE